MIAKEIQSAYNQANQRWPEISWPLRDYKEHLEMIPSNGTDVKYPIDYYLAGSAGHRVDLAWATIHEDIRPEVLKVLRRYPEGEYSIDDLWAETVLKLMDDDDRFSKLPDGRYHAKIIRYRGLVRLINYFITIARRLAIQQYRKKKPESFSDELIDKLKVDITPQDQISCKEQIRHIEKSLQKALDLLTEEQKFLIVMVYREGMKQKDVAKIIGLSDFTANRRIKSAIKTIKESIVEIVNEGKLDLKIWQQVWEAAWPNLK